MIDREKKNICRIIGDVLERMIDFDSSKSSPLKGVTEFVYITKLNILHTIILLSLDLFVTVICLEK